MRSLEIAQPRQQPAGGEGPDHAHRQHLAEAPAGETVQGDGYAVEGVGEHRVQRRAFVGERHPARQAVEQRDLQALFQAADLVAQRGLADAQLQRRAGEIEVTCGGLEGAQGVERKLGADHA